MDDPICGDALRASGTLIGKVQVKILEDWVIRRKPIVRSYEMGLLRDYTGRDCDVQDIVQPATPVLPGGQGKPDAGS